jgi:hypothetical protein
MVFGTNEAGETSEYRYNALGARVFNEQLRGNWNVGHQNAPRFRGSIIFLTIQAGRFSFTQQLNVKIGRITFTFDA